ncbi:hypothetical protein FXN63_08790 [Pigmentiphaga aceris]|uniref:Phosphoglycerate mutase n=1 Tax=Pigmentiphaga aceris TaxID=1940612 RepID=A0A5C0AYI5_9BURK|nr:hypothetical protein [Pigmentiphaga aceris]QEI05930.1 hypothetical protein FXN63_08790 [Pigmentiphaga aceris]
MPTSSTLTLVLPGTLPPPNIAGDLAKALHAPVSPTPGSSPVFSAWLSRAKPVVSEFDISQQGCSPYEGWWLTRAGYNIQAAQTNRPPEAPAPVFGAGLAPLLAPSATGTDPVWIGRLAHIRISQDHLALANPDELQVTEEESIELANAAQNVFELDGFALHRLSAQDWRVVPVSAGHPGISGATPAAAVDRDIDAWWPQGAVARPWRRLVNEIQMEWYAHPVNEARRDRGQPEINTLWLFGGSAPWQPKLNAARLAGGPAWVQGIAQAAGLPWAPLNEQAIAPGTIASIDSLETAHREEDWGRWLIEMARLDASLFTAAQQALAEGRVDSIELILTGHDRIAQLVIPSKRGLARLLPTPKHDWTSWWSNPNS